MDNKIVVFESQQIRRIWHDEQWYFSVVDVCRALTDSPDAGAYWRKLKQRLSQEGSEVVTFCHGLKLEAPDQTVTKCHGLKMPAADGKMRLTADYFMLDSRLRGNDNSSLAQG